MRSPDLGRCRAYRRHMGETVELDETDAQMVALLARVEAGEQIMFERDGIPVALLKAVPSEPPQ